LVEYAFILVLIALVVIAILLIVGHGLSSTYSNISSQIGAA